MRLDEETPASKAMEFYRETLESKGCRGTPRKTLVTTISNKIKRVLEVDPTFPLKPTKITTDLQHARHLAKDRIYWKRTMVGVICSAAASEKPL